MKLGANYIGDNRCEYAVWADVLDGKDLTIARQRLKISDVFKQLPVTLLTGGK